MMRPLGSASSAELASHLISPRNNSGTGSPLPLASSMASMGRCAQLPSSAADLPVLEASSDRSCAIYM